jgi:tripartite-type tricarboxylate transporter receptor subunit TctC
MKKLLSIFALAAALSTTLAAPASAQTWPSKPIRIIVPFTAGASIDGLTRFVGARLSEGLGQPVIVENVLGAGGQVGMDRAAKAPADGYTLVTGADSLNGLAPLLGPLPYDAARGFTPVGALASMSYAVIANRNSRFQNLGALLKEGKEKPDTVSVGSTGVGVLIHLGSLLLEQKSGAKFNVIQYKGAAPIVNDIMGGHLDFSFNVIGNSIELITAQKVKGLATTGTRRHPLLPDVPTVAETISGFELTGWFALFGPPGMPPEVTRKLNEQLNKVVESDDYKKFLASQGYGYMRTTPAELAGLVQQALAKYGEMIKALPPGAASKQ